MSLVRARRTQMGVSMDGTVTRRRGLVSRQPVTYCSPGSPMEMSDSAIGGRWGSH
jgi:hypothetical protein